MLKLTSMQERVLLTTKNAIFEETQADTFPSSTVRSLVTRKLVRILKNGYLRLTAAGRKQIEIPTYTQTKTPTPVESSGGSNFC